MSQAGRWGELRNGDPSQSEEPPPTAGLLGWVFGIMAGAGTLALAERAADAIRTPGFAALP